MNNLWQPRTWNVVTTGRPNFQPRCSLKAPLMLLLPQHHPHGPPSHWLGRQALHHLGQHCVQSGGTQGTTKLHPHTHTLVCFTESQKHGYNITNHRSTGYSYQKNQIKTMQRQSLSPINFKMPNIEIWTLACQSPATILWRLWKWIMTVSRDNGIMQSSHDIVVGQVIGYRVPTSLFLGLRWCLDWTSRGRTRSLKHSKTLPEHCKTYWLICT